MVEVARQRRPGLSLLGHQGEAASRAHQRAEASTKVERRDVTTVEGNIQAAFSGMASASIQHVGRAVDALQGQARVNERNEEAAVANSEFERRPGGPTNHVCVDRVVGERGTRWHPSVVGNGDHAVVRCAHREPVDKPGGVSHSGILLDIRQLDRDRELSPRGSRRSIGQSAD
jgi:hypothetical protein